MFATGSIQWSWGLDGYNAPAWHTPRLSDAAQRITRNVLDRMLQAPTADRRTTGSRPSPIVLAAMVIAAAYVLRAWIWRRMKSHDA